MRPRRVRGVLGGRNGRVGDLLVQLLGQPPVRGCDDPGLEDDEQQQEQRAERTEREVRDPAEAEDAEEQRDDDAGHQHDALLVGLPLLAQVHDDADDHGDHDQREEQADEASEEATDHLPAATEVEVLGVGVVATDRGDDEDVHERHEQRGEPEMQTEHDVLRFEEV